MIYRTENGCGWGVKTKDFIKRGQFAVEYVGEVISSEVAEERGKKYGENEQGSGEILGFWFLPAATQVYTLVVF